ncbi:hypothetical protein AG0111_0g11690 [Alternaria gaisen]|uniref:Uncharacterized protein n=1 Tax=Alternaria gaisen TaxID=167740 RepID=A0ACB6F6G8_9PLEO|nr:hypothetical protein AG0111_0g11690 [Alternaria gaisen]
MPRYLTQLGQLSSLIDHVAEKVAKVLPRLSVYRPGVDEACLPSIADFVLYVTIRSYTTIPELMMSLIYLSWFRGRLHPAHLGRPSTPHRVFLAALMLAHKVHNDDSVNNACWADLSVIPECGFAGFSNVEVNLMEAQFLAALGWDVHIDADLYELFSREIYITTFYPPPPSQTEQGWVCGCCICIDWWTCPAQGLSHCTTCLTPSYAEVEMQKKVLAVEQSHALQPSPTENEVCVALHHHLAPAGHHAQEKCNRATKTNAF